MHVFLLLSRWLVTPKCSVPHTSRTFTAFAKRYDSLNGKNHTRGENSIRPSLSVAASPVKYKFTVAQIARRAAKEIRMAVQVGNVSEALIVSNSVLASPLNRRITSFRFPLGSPSVIFNRPLPSRLVSHCLVHALMRGGYTIQSGAEVQKMIDLGIRFHSKTLTSVIVLLCSRETQDYEMVNFSTRSVYETQASPEDSPTGHMISSQSSRLPPKARLAVNILSTARRRRHRRTEDMYGRLIDACLLQGEIIIATLLFVLLVKDWQLRRVLSPSLLREAAIAESTARSGATLEQDRFKNADFSPRCAGQTDSGLTPERKRFQELGFPAFRYAKQSGLIDPSFRLPCPEKHLLEPILKNINHHVLSRDSADETRLESIDSIAILAAVVADRSISLKRMNSIIQCIQNCPSSPAHIITIQALDGEWREINAYDEVHHVLVELCHSLPGDGPSRVYAKSTNSSLQLLPRLDLAAYNSLIHYALRHRMSLALASKVIEHMVGGKSPVEPDIVTYNILLRSASLLTRNDLAGNVLHDVSKRLENSGSIINSLPLGQAQNPIYDLEGRGKRKTYQPKYPFWLDSIHEELIIPAVIGKSKRLKADEYTLSSYITYIVSTGRPDAVVHLVSQLLPAICRDTTDTAQDLSKNQRLQIHRESVQRAVKYGPYVLSTLLNALCKAGKTGLAEQVWKIAREAEVASWREPSSLEKHSPWCLPIQAYTSMLQCYADESKKGLTRIRNASHSSLMPIDLTSQSTHDRRKVYVHGWAGHILHSKNQDVHNLKPLRSEISRLAAWRLVNEMRDPGTTIWEEAIRICSNRYVKEIPRAWAVRLQSMRFPTPDARFFNVLLRIFGGVNMPFRRVRQSCSRARRVLCIARARFTKEGELFQVHDITLIEVVTLMAQFGYELPLGFRRVLVGRAFIPIQSGVARAYKVHPWAFPKVKRGTGAFRRRRLFSLEVFKTRGLPVQRINKRRMGLNSLVPARVPDSLDTRKRGDQLTVD